MVDNQCVFCKIISGEINSDEVYDDKSFIGILDKNPRVEGHTLIIPKKHFRNILDMPTTLGNELLDAVKKISLKLIEEQKAEGINIIINNESAADQAVFHTHVHIIPRKNSDGIKFFE